MSRHTDSLYSALQTPTSTRVLILCPGFLDDPEIFCWLLPCDLDKDPHKFPGSPERPIGTFSVVAGKSDDGTERKFTLEYDMYSDGSSDVGNSGDVAVRLQPSRHPFQRYNALSYTWGDKADSVSITLNGNHSMCVTKKLYNALYSMRNGKNSLRLWVDAICINQADHKEKENQIGLMRRIYAQAEGVIVYIPLEAQDRLNILELVPKILEAGKRCHEARKSSHESTAEAARVNSVPSATDLVPMSLPASEDVNQVDTVVSRRDHITTDPEAHFLENYDLPAEESPLWVSWRRLFADPYFRRIWIVQEVALAKRVLIYFGIGSKLLDAEHLLTAKFYILMYSGARNLDYLGEADSGDPKALTHNAILGGKRAERLSMERYDNKGYLERKQPREKLIKKLEKARIAEATDARDKIYALLGLVEDGDYFWSSVSYAPTDTYVQIFIRFARLFVEKGEGFDVLLEAGLGIATARTNSGLPSWVPDWTKFNIVPRPVDYVSQTSTQSCLRISGDNDTLLATCAVIDEIQHISNIGFRNRAEEEGDDERPALTMTEKDFIFALWGCLSFIGRLFKNNEEMSLDFTLEDIFELLTQVPGQSQQSSQDVSNDPQTESVKDKVEKHTLEMIKAAVDPDIDKASLHAGFLYFIDCCDNISNYIGALEKKERLLYVVKDPNAYYEFLERAVRIAGNRRFCITVGGKIGLAPDAAVVGDHVIVFDECSIPFVIRRVDEQEKDGNKNKYILVGSGYFHKLNLPGPEDEKQDILLV